MRWFDYMIQIAAIPFALALALVVIAIVIGNAIVTFVKRAGAICRRLIDEAESSGLVRELGFSRKDNRNAR